VVGDDHGHGEVDAVRVEAKFLSVAVDDSVGLAAVPDEPDKDAGDDRVDIHEEDQLEEALAVDERACVGVQLSHREGEVLLLLNCAVVLEADLLVVDAVVEHEPVGHQDVEASNEEVINRLEARGTVGELDTVLGGGVDDRLNEHHDREVLDSPAVATTVPEQSSSEVLKAGNGIVSEGGSLVSLFAHQAEAKISRLDHVHVVGTVADSQSDLAVGELLHEGDDLGFLSGRGAVDNDGLGSHEECTKFWVHEFVVEGDRDHHAGNQNLVALDGLAFFDEALDFLVKLSSISIIVFEDHDVLSARSVTLGFSHVLLSGYGKVLGSENLTSVNVLFLRDQAAGDTDFSGSLAFVTSEHPNANSSSSEVLDAFLNIFLEQILDTSSSKDSQIAFNLGLKQVKRVSSAVPLNFFHSVEQRAEAFPRHRVDAVFQIHNLVVRLALPHIESLVTSVVAGAHWEDTGVGSLHEADGFFLGRVLQHDRHCLSIGSEWEHLNNRVDLFFSVEDHFDSFGVAADEVANSRGLRHFKQANLVDRWAVVHKLVRVLLVLERDAVMAQVDALEEVAEGAMFVVVETQVLQSFVDLVHIGTIFESQFLALLQSQPAEAQLVLSQGAGFVAENVLHLGELFRQVQGVGLETDNFTEGRLDDHHFGVVLHNRREH